MSKSKPKSRDENPESGVSSGVSSDTLHQNGVSQQGARQDSPGSIDSERLCTQFYETELKRLHIELVKLQEWIRHARKRVVILFEGRDAAGKGGTIKRITEPLNPHSRTSKGERRLHSPPDERSKVRAQSLLAV